MIFNILNYVIASVTLITPAVTNYVPDYSYFNMNGGPTIGFYKNASTVAVGDETLILSDCSTTTTHCVNAEGVYISIPTEDIGFSQNGEKTQFIKTTDLKFLGKSIDTQIFETKHHGAEFVYWYSKKNGLIAFSILFNNKTVTYLLSQEYGLKFK